MRNWLLTTEPKPPEFYKGILVHADIGVHDQAIHLCQRHVPEGSVLDVGAGAGAFAQRLSDLGYKVTALDSDPVNWKADLPLTILDIDKGFANSLNEYDLAVCLEVIEHLENPWSLFRELHSVVKPGGYLLLSTPNVTSFYSRANFMLSGRFHQFEDGDLSYGHINPVTDFEIEQIARATGWELVEVRAGGSLSVIDLTELRPFLWMAALTFLRLVSYIVARGQKNGWCLFYLLRRV